MSRVRLSILSASLLVAACSGGTDQFGNEGSEPPTGTFDITSTNGLAATRVAWESVVASGELTDLGGNLGLSAAPGSLTKASLARPDGLMAKVVQNVSYGAEIIPCDPAGSMDSGTVDITSELADPFTLSAGDTFSVQFAMCDEGLGEVVDGLIEFTVGDFTGDLFLGTYMLSMDAVVTDLQVITATDTQTSNGDATLTLDTVDTPFIYAGTSGTSMTTDSNASTETITNYQSSQTVDGNQQNLPYTMTASGTLDTTQLAGVVTYSTPIEFSGEGVDYPSVGVLLVQGANSSARLTAIDNVNVMIELDVDGDGDGEADQTINTTWDDLTT